MKINGLEHQLITLFQKLDDIATCLIVLIDDHGEDGCIKLSVDRMLSVHPGSWIEDTTVGQFKYLNIREHETMDQYMGVGAINAPGGSPHVVVPRDTRPMPSSGSPMPPRPLTPPIVSVPKDNGIQGRQELRTVPKAPVDKDAAE